MMARMTRVVGRTDQSLVESLEGEAELMRIEPQQRQDRGLQITDAHGVFGDGVCKIVGLSVTDPWFHAATGHPDGKTVGMMIPAQQLDPLRASFMAVRPNSPPQITRVSSSRPRCDRSVSKAAMG